jgi:hypothetical protein
LRRERVTGENPRGNAPLAARSNRGIQPHMVTRRTLLKQGASAALAWPALPALIGSAYAQAPNPSGFDYYIGPNGDDNNPGTYAQPWAITAINTRRAVYAGKRIGLLDGTYNVHALCQKGGATAAALAINGGPSGGPPTVVAAVNSRQAILTGAEPGSGAYPTNASPIIGQGNLQTQNKGNVVIDGLVITRSYQYGIGFYAPVGKEYLTSLVEGGASGIVVRNCEIYDIGGLINNNVGGIVLQFCTGALISNNKIHAVQPPNIRNANPADCAAILSFRCHSNIYEYNTIYDCNVGIYDKNNTNGNHTFRYNYIEVAGLTPCAPLIDCAGGNPGDILTVHNNVMVGPTIWYGLDALVMPSPQSLVFYNNTCLCGGQRPVEHGIFYSAGANTVSPAATVTFYNNIVQCSAPVGAGGLVSFLEGSVVLSDYNVLSAAGSTRLLSLAPVLKPRAAPKLYTLEQWRSATGMDQHSSASTVAFASAMDRTAAGFQLQTSSAALNAGRIGGTSAGAPTAVGAWGGDATQVGCNFGLSPRPVSLSVS